MALAVFAAEILVRQTEPLSLTALLLTAILTTGYGLIVLLLRGPLSVDPKLATQRDLFRLSGAIALGSAATGSVYVSALALLGLIDSAQIATAIVRFWIGEVVGMAVTLPLLFSITEVALRQRLMGKLGRRETLAQATVMGLVLWFVFGPGTADQFKYFYVLFLPLVWVAARDGLAGAIWANALIQCSVILTVQVGGQTALSTFELQALLIALVLTGLFLGVTVDERESVAENLRHARHLATAGEIAGGLAHELHQPLTALTSYAKVVSLISDRPGDQRPALQAVLEKIRDEVNRASEVLHRLRDFFRTGALRLEPADLSILVRDVLTKIESSGATRGIEVSLTSAGDSGELLLDRTQMSIVLRNLISNAIEAVCAANASAKRVDVEISGVDPAQMLITVRDTGTGLTHERAAALFEPLATTKPSGMGLGLVISKSIVHAHGGELWAEPGASGVFKVRLPRAAPP